MKSTPTRALFPGSFDPFTLGHLEIVRQALAFVDQVVVAIAVNTAKKPLLSGEERQVAATQTLQAVGLGDRVEVVQISGLLADFCVANHIDVIVKGLRNAADFTYEAPMATVNQDLGGPGTVFIPSSPQWAHISSSLVKELARYGANITQMVEDKTAQMLYRALGTSPGAAPDLAQTGQQERK